MRHASMQACLTCVALDRPELGYERLTPYESSVTTRPTTNTVLLLSPFLVLLSVTPLHPKGIQETLRSKHVGAFYVAIPAVLSFFASRQAIRIVMVSGGCVSHTLRAE